MVLYPADEKVIKIYTISSATTCVSLMQNDYTAIDELETAVCVMQTFAYMLAITQFP
jgi:hypothetical protein